MAAVDPTTVIPPELDFVPGPPDDLESIIWVLTYAFMLRHQESLQELRKAHYKRDVVDQFHGSLSYSELAKERNIMVSHGSNAFADEPEKWFPDPTECRWFRRAMTLVEGQLKPYSDGSIKDIAFDTLMRSATS